jgi:hypothetical protein
MNNPIARYSYNRLVEWIRGKIYGFRALIAFDNWPSLLLQRVFLREYPVFYRKGAVTFLADHSACDQEGLCMCFTTDMYSRFFSHFPRSRQLAVLDLGANSGGFGLLLLADGFRFEGSLALRSLRESSRDSHSTLDTISDLPRHP